MATQAEHSSTNRRDFLYVASGAVGAVGAAAVVWPLINQLNPDASTLALASIEFDVSAIPEGQSVTITWRGLPVFVRHRTAAEIEQALNLLGKGPRELMRKGEAAYAELGLDDPSLTRTQLIDAMTARPVLIERPIVFANGKAVVGRPPETVLAIL